LLLRASSELAGDEANLTSVVRGSTAQSGIAGGEELTAYAEAALADDADAISTSRDQVRSVLGDEATVDAAAVIANFQRMVRIADGAGIPLDEPVLMMSQGIRDELHLNDFGGARNSAPLPWHKKFLGRAAAPFMPKMLKRMAQRRKIDA